MLKTDDDIISYRKKLSLPAITSISNLPAREYPEQAKFIKGETREYDLVDMKIKSIGYKALSSGETESHRINTDALDPTPLHDSNVQNFGQKKWVKWTKLETITNG